MMREWIVLCRTLDDHGFNTPDRVCLCPELKVTNLDAFEDIEHLKRAAGIPEKYLLPLQPVALELDTG